MKKKFLIGRDIILRLNIYVRFKSNRFKHL